MGTEQEPVTVKICEAASQCGPEQMQRCAEFVYRISTDFNSQLQQARERTSASGLHPYSSYRQ